MQPLNWLKIYPKQHITQPFLRVFFSLLFVFFCSTLQSQSKDRKILNIQRTTTPPKIDGILNDEAWKDAEIATKFVQFRPEIGNIPPEDQRTEVKVTYDDQAIYVAAYLYDDPKLIMKQLTSRDNFGQSDFFMVVFFITRSL